jgi:PQQ-like domain
VTLIELGEPARYDPGTPPLLQRRAGLPKARRVLAALMVLLAGAIAGAEPRDVRAPVVHTVGRFAEHPEIYVAGDIVLAQTQDARTLIASALDGSGERWRTSIGDGGMIWPVAPAGNAVVLLEAANGSTSLTAVDVGTGKEVWRRDGNIVLSLDGEVVIRLPGAVGAFDIGSGRELWRRAVAPEVWVGPVERKDGSPPTEVIIAQPDGTLFVLDARSGAAGPSWRIAVSRLILWYAWEDLVIAQGGTDSGTEMAVYRRGEPNPLWRKRFTSEPEVWPCGLSFCDGQGRLDPYTGIAETAVTEPPTSPGKWEPIGEYAGRVLVRLDASWTADAKTWLGVVRPDGSVRPLLALGGRSNQCILTESWLYCDGSAVVDAVSVRLSDLDSMLTEVGGPA